ncbi:hypothetical protein PX699_06600 [Sphingobium sp. H39-3-25]|uniref:hypothetical protein n=1 Tax=Sphingobium arseniciresistens TaxID=3030834 RepID=UPI0023B9ACB7|nr:hypothetical protein [Sphingobium arseniciresistens]
MLDATSGFDIGWEGLMFVGMMVNPFLIAISVLVGWFARRWWHYALAPVWSAVVTLLLWPLVMGGSAIMDPLSLSLLPRMVLPALLIAVIAARIRRLIAG